MFFKRRNKYRISFIDDGILGYLCCLYKKVLFQQFQSLSFRYVFFKRRDKYRINFMIEF